MENSPFPQSSSFEFWSDFEVSGDTHFGGKMENSPFPQSSGFEM